MKKIAIVFFTAMMAFSGLKVSAQGKFGPDSADCVKYLSYYKEYYKQKNYDDALPNWRKAYKLCPATASQKMILDGATMMRRLIRKNASNPTYQKELIDTLLTLHDVRRQYYPKYAVKALNNKGLDMANYVRNNPEFLYKGFSNIIDENKSKTNPSLFVLNLSVAIDLYKEDKLGADKVIETYQNSLAYLDEAKDARGKEQRETVKADLENLFISSKVASCDNLISLFQPRFDADKDNVDLVKNIVKMMTLTEGCTENELFIAAATQLNQLEPSANSAYYLYKLFAGRDEVEKATKYLEESVSYEDEDPSVLAVRRFELAKYSLENGNNVKAYSNANKVIELDPSLAGKCYYLIGTIWGSVKCSGNEIEQRAPYWVAVDYMIKAKKADPEIAADANKLIGQYSTYFPQAAEAFMYDITNGQSYTVSCSGLRATTTVRTQK